MEKGKECSCGIPIGKYMEIHPIVPIFIANTPPGDLVPLYFVCQKTRREIAKNHKHFPDAVRSDDIKCHRYRSQVMDEYLQRILLQALTKKDEETAACCLRLGCYTIFYTTLNTPQIPVLDELLTADPHRANGHNMEPIVILNSSHREIRIHPYDILLAERQGISFSCHQISGNKNSLIAAAIDLALELDDVDVMVKVANSFLP